MRILLLDDHALFREGLKTLLGQALPGAEVVEATALRQALALAAADHAFDLMLVDLDLPDARQVDAPRAMIGALPHVPLIIISMTERRDHVRQAIELGARGFISKADSSRQMMATIEAVLAGGTSIPARFIEPTGMSPPTVDRSQLSSRQTEVLGLLAEGLSNKEIATRLGIAEMTVKVHVHHVLRALGTTSRAKAAVLARAQGDDRDS